MSNYIRPEQARSILKVTDESLKRWAKAGKIECIKTKGGHRRYDISKLLPEAKQPATTERKRICYARVSSQGQKKDLETQLEYFRVNFPKHTCVQDIGSGLNFKRKGFLSLLDDAITGNIEEIVITHKDRLFGFEIIQRIVESKGGRIMVLHKEKLSAEQELVQDLLAITTVFSAKLYGLRSYSLRRKIRCSNKAQETQSHGKAIQDFTGESFSDGE